MNNNNGYFKIVMTNVLVLLMSFSLAFDSLAGFGMNIDNSAKTISRNNDISSEYINFFSGGVYYTEYGEYYHYKYGCSGAVYPIPQKVRTYKPCPKCCGHRAKKKSSTTNKYQFDNSPFKKENQKKNITKNNTEKKNTIKESTNKKNTNKKSEKKKKTNKKK